MTPSHHGVGSGSERSSEDTGEAPEQADLCAEDGLLPAGSCRQASGGRAGVYPPLGGGRAAIQAGEDTVTLLLNTTAHAKFIHPPLQVTARADPASRRPRGSHHLPNLQNTPCPKSDGIFLLRDHNSTRNSFFPSVGGGREGNSCCK